MTDDECMSERNVNPYATPEVDAKSSSEEPVELRVFTAQGRLGRLRYMAYGAGSIVVAGILLAGMAVAAAVALSAEAAGGINAVWSGFVIGLGILVLVLYVLWTVRRLHDFKLSGWFTFIFILPPINCVLWLIPGTRGANRYGPMQPANGAGVVLMALFMLLIVLLLVGSLVLAAAIPAEHHSFAKHDVPGTPQTVEVMIADPRLPYGSHSVRVYLISESNKVLLIETKLHNDGATLGDENISLLSIDARTARFCFSGEEQGSQVSEVDLGAGLYKVTSKASKDC